MPRRKRFRRMRSQSFLEGLGSRLDTKGNGKHAAVETGKDFIFSVLLGGAAAAIIGKPSLLVGAGVTGLGYYLGVPIASHVGVGMMATTVGSMLNANGVAGLEGLDGVKERLSAFKQSLMERTYIDKILPKSAVSGIPVGDLQYFDYGRMSGVGENPELYGLLGDTDDLAALDDIERQIELAGIERLQGMDVSGLSALSITDEQASGIPLASSAPSDNVAGTIIASDTQITGNPDPNEGTAGLQGNEDAEIGIITLDGDMLGDVSEFNY